MIGLQCDRGRSFLRKNAIDPMPLTVMIAHLREFLPPVLASASPSSSHDMAWRVGEGWQYRAETP